MSHLSQTYRYPLPADPGFRLLQQARAVREPGPDQGIPNLIELTDGITERLEKAEALTRLLMNENAALECLPNAAWAVADLIREARELYDQQWERVKPRNRGEASRPMGSRRK